MTDSPIIRDPELAAVLAELQRANAIFQRAEKALRDMAAKQPIPSSGVAS